MKSTAATLISHSNTEDTGINQRNRVPSSVRSLHPSIHLRERDECKRSIWNRLPVTREERREVAVEGRVMPHHAYRALPVPSHTANRGKEMCLFPVRTPTSVPLLENQITSANAMSDQRREREPLVRRPASKQRQQLAPPLSLLTGTLTRTV